MKLKDNEKSVMAVYSQRSKIYGVLLLTLLFVSPVFSQKTAEWTIGDYLKNLPEEYKTFSGDFQTEPTAETTVLDVKNGYAAYLSSSEKDAYPIFEMAIFKQANGDSLIVVSNTIADSVCTFHQTFFLQRKVDSWLAVRSKVLPEFTAQMFFKDAKLSAKFTEANKKIGNAEKLDLHFSPPREGTRMKVSLDICDYVPDELAAEISFNEFIKNARTVSLEWDKRKGIFKQVN